MRLFTELLQGKRERYQIEKRYIRKDGQVVWGMLTTSLLRRPGGEPEYCIRMAENITGHKHADEARRASEERFRILFERAPDGHYLMDLNGVFLDGNRAAEQLAGYRREELIGKTLAEAGFLSPAELQKALHLLTRCALGEPVEFEAFRLIRSDGGTVDVEIRAIPTETAEGRATIAIIRDITHRKRAERVESIVRLAGGVAHDFNDLLTVINGYAELVLNQLQEGDPLRERVNQIRNAGERAAGLTRQLLIFSRKQVVERKPLDLNAVAGEAGKMPGRLSGGDVELVAELDGGDI
jgi:hypothetical protein